MNFTIKYYSYYLFAWTRARYGQEASTGIEDVCASAATALGVRDGLTAHKANAGDPQTFLEVEEAVHNLLEEADEDAP